jgi:hypothetical protein
MTPDTISKKCFMKTEVLATIVSELSTLSKTLSVRRQKEESPLTARLFIAE